MNEFKNILDSVWIELNNGVKPGGHNYHIFCLTTVDKKNPHSRNVVLRSADREKNSFSCHTDIRSEKVLHLGSNKNVSALFYDPKKRIQIRIDGLANAVNKKDSLKARWDASEKMSKLCYINQCPPGARLKKPLDYLPLKKDDKAIEDGFKNFCILDIKIKQIDWLILDCKGHKRAKFIFNEEKLTNSYWVSP